MKVHHGLGGASADDAGEGPALESHHVLGSAGGNDDGVGLVVRDLLALTDNDLFVLVEADDRGVETDVDTKAGGLPSRLRWSRRAVRGAIFRRLSLFLNRVERLPR